MGCKWDMELLMVNVKESGVAEQRNMFFMKQWKNVKQLANKARSFLEFLVEDKFVDIHAATCESRYHFISICGKKMMKNRNPNMYALTSFPRDYYSSTLV